MQKNYLKIIIKPIRFCIYRIGLLKNHIFSVMNYHRFFKERILFERMGGKITHDFVILSDYHADAGIASGHYFHQDLLVAQFIYQKNPLRHIDVGSRIDGFVAHVASFRQIEIMDLRSLKSSGHTNILFLKADLMNHENVQNEICDSISCLNAIEHFGLGRYGDSIDPTGHVKGFQNLIRMLKPGGILYISFPIGQKNEVHFNAHRVFHPKDIFSWLRDSETFRLERFDYVDDAGDLHKDIDLTRSEINVSFGCGIYTLKKI